MRPGRKPGTPKTGGRQKGSLNKDKAEVAEKLAALGCDPIEGMATIAMDPQSPVDLRGRMFSELAQYVHSKLRAVEVTGAGGGALQVQVLKFTDADPTSR